MLNSFSYYSGVAVRAPVRQYPPEKFLRQVHGLRRGREEAREDRWREARGPVRGSAALGAERLEDDDVEAGCVYIALERSRGAHVGEEREERLDGARAPGQLRVPWNAVTSVNRLV